ncbi:arylesterase [Celeribacter neptunius]|uniref:Acyl-CoA thioesterase-1 n=1 Tax=Celeribacter neptunius TaxID=588602 RepID=A0A1I3UUH9_9RHOB|nr:arylesterase [Celeribacter neptunius]SFJ86319.1 acyl-CoA thioesterase-1 [Celeribacter neptunius]
MSAFLKKYGVLARIDKPLATLLVTLMLIGGTLPAEARPLRIAALGDSLTEGYGLIAQNGFTAQLQSWLDARHVEATIVNAGVSGDTTAGGLSRVDWTLTPDIGAMIVALGGNDLLRGLSPDLSRSNLAGILDVAKEKGIPVLLVGMEAPGNYGAEYKATFDAIYPDLAAEYDTLYFEGFLKPLTDLGLWEQVLKDYMQPDGVHPNAEGVARIVEAMGPVVAELAERAGASEQP